MLKLRLNILNCFSGRKRLFELLENCLSYNPIEKLTSEEKNIVNVGTFEGEANNFVWLRKTPDVDKHVEKRLKPIFFVY